MGAVRRKGTPEQKVWVPIDGEGLANRGACDLTQPTPKNALSGISLCCLWPTEAEHSASPPYLGKCSTAKARMAFSLQVDLLASAHRSKKGGLPLAILATI